MSVTLRRSRVPETDVSRAWARYLQETRRAKAAEDYSVIEEQAWRRLVVSLDALGDPLQRQRMTD